MRQYRGILFISPKLCLHPGNQFKGTEWFCHIIIRSQRQSCNLIRFLIFCRQHDHRISMFFTDFLTESKTIHIRQHDIKDCKISFFLFDKSQCFPCGIIFINGVIFILQINFEQICNILFIINNQNPFRHTGSLPLCYNNLFL